MTLKNNRAPLLYHFKLYASFRSHRWIQAGVTVQKRAIWVKIDHFFSCVTLQFDVWPWKTIHRAAWSQLKMMSWLSSTCIQNFPSSLVFILEIDNYFKHTEIALTHWGRVTHICVGKLTIIGSDNGLSPDRRQAIIWANTGILSIWPLGTKLSEILSAIHVFLFKKMHPKMSSGKWQPSCLGLNVLFRQYITNTRWKESLILYMFFISTGFTELLQDWGYTTFK